MTDDKLPKRKPAIRSSSKLVIYPVAEPPAPREVRPRDLGGTNIRGVLDTIAGRIVEGWAADPDLPDQPVTVEIFADQNWLGSAVAMSYRADLAEAGLGTGHHHFNFLLPIELFDGRPHLISVRPRGRIQDLENSPMHLAGPAPAVSSMAGAVQAPVATGMLDVVSEDGWVQGWAWFPAAPTRRAAVEILVDGVVVGSTLAGLHRADLAAAGIGDGNYGFSFALPFEILSRAREAMVSVREQDFGEALDAPRVFRRRAVADAMEKLDALEQDVRFLRAALVHATDAKTQGERDSAALFRTVGDFFVQLAETAESGRPVGTLRTLRGAVAEITSTLAPLDFDAPAHPHFSFCIEARFPVGIVHTTLRAVQAMSAGRQAEVVLFDTGACDDAPLLPLVARNIRYLRISRPGMPAAFNQAAACARGRILIFLAANAEPLTDWLESLTTAFTADDTLAILGAKIQFPDGVLAHAGALRTDGRVVCRGVGENPADDAFSTPRPIDGVAQEAFAVRAETWHKIGGLNENGDDLAAALDDLCARAAAHGAAISYHPDFNVVLNNPDSAEPPDGVV